MKKVVKCLLLIVSLSTLTGCNTFHDHVYEKEVIIKNPTCTEYGEGYLQCLDCDKHTENIEIQPLGHYYWESVIPATCTEGGYTVHTCLRCGDTYKDNYTEPLGHDYHSYVTNATCVDDGLEECFCTRCGLDKYDSITLPHLGHDFVKKVVEPTCIREGYTEYKCKNCGYTYLEDRTNKISHDFVDVHIEPTCLYKGCDRHTCKLCGYVYEDNIVVCLGGHDYVEHEGKDATCNEDGWYPYLTCSRCSYSTYKVMKSTGHHTIDVVTPASCLEGGYTTHTCTICNEVYVDNETAPLGHDLISVESKEPTCTECGHNAYEYCSRCDYSTYEEISPIGGDHNYISTVVEPTKTSRGYTLHECDICHDTYKDNYVDPVAPSTCYDSNEAIEKYIHSDKLIDSYRDDDYYYFMLYQGSIDDFVLFKYRNLLWNKGVEELGTYPKVDKEAHPVSLQSDISSRLAKVNSSISSDLENINLDIDSVTKVLDNSMDLEMSALLYDGFNANALELNGESYSILCDQINEYEKYSFDTSFMEYGNYYSYTSTVNLDLYVGFRYKISEKTIEYKTYTSLTSNIQENIYCSTKDDIGEFNEQISLTNEALSLVVEPTKYTNNHPKIISHCGYDDFTMKPLHTSTKLIQFFSCSDLYNSGYDMLHFKITFNYSKSGDAACHIQVCDYDSHHSISGEERDYTNPGNITFEFDQQTSTIVSANGFSIVFNNRNYFKDYYIKNLKVEVTAYCSRAEYED